MGSPVTSLWPLSSCPASPPLPCQRGPVAYGKGAALHPGERAGSSRLQPPACKMIKWVLIAAQRLTLILLSFLWHSVSKGPNTHSFISFFFFKDSSFLIFLMRKAKQIYGRPLRKYKRSINTIKKKVPVPLLPSYTIF